jgi:hypothetical protein
VPTIRFPVDQPRKVAVGCALIVAILVLIGVGLVVAGRTLERALDATLDRIRPAALSAAAGTTAAYLAGLGMVRWTRRPRRPLDDAALGEIGRDLPALRAEPPAVAGFLAAGFEPRREGVPATLLDLAARGVLGIEGIGDELLVRIRKPADGGTLLPHEQRVLDIVRRRAKDGSVPGAALTSGPRQHAGRWWREFRNEVIDEAQARGLSRDLWDQPTLLAFGGASIAPAVFVLLGTRLWGAAVAYLVAAFVLLTWIRERRAQRDTDAGLAAAGDWTEVRTFLRSGQFEELPPASVTIWERYLAYAAAFGVARAAVEAIPMGAEEDRRAWSSHGGRWREVRIRYPFAWPPAWGWLPAVALAVSIAGIVASAGLLRLAAGIGWPQQGLGDPPGLVAFVRGLAVAAGAAGGLIGLWSIVTLVRSVADLGRTRQVAGQVLRLRTFGGSSDDPGRHYLALDDGTADTVRAWRVPDELWASAPPQFRTATVTVWPHLGRVRSLG